MYAKFLLPALLAVFFISCTEEPITTPGLLVPMTVDQDPSLPSITVNGVQLHAEAFGPPDSTMVVCIHGGPGSDYRYMLHAKDLAAQGYRVVFYDQRGSGLSQRLPKSSYLGLGAGAIDAMFEEVSGVIAHFRTRPQQKVILLGHSWGAMLASGYAGKHPDAIQGLVVCEPGGLQWQDIETYVTNSQSFKIWSELLNDATYLDQFITGKEDEHEILDYKLNLLAANNDITGEDNTMPESFWRSGAIINEALFEIGEDDQSDFSAGLKDFQIPVMFFYSENNKAYPDSWMQHITKAYKTVDVIKVPGTGHDGIIKDDQAWTQTTMPHILEYLQSL